MLRWIGGMEIDADPSINFKGQSRKRCGGGAFWFVLGAEPETQFHGQLLIFI
jgi:hypothetical protein